MDPWNKPFICGTVVLGLRVLFVRGLTDLGIGFSNVNFSINEASERSGTADLVVLCAMMVSRVAATRQRPSCSQIKMIVDEILFSV